MEYEVSISNMMFGLTCAALELVIGVGEMSVCADSTGVEIIDDRTSAHTMASRKVCPGLAPPPFFFFFCIFFYPDDAGPPLSSR
jgi:hypothetical protein